MKQKLVEIFNKIKTNKIVNEGINFIKKHKYIFIGIAIALLITIILICILGRNKEPIPMEDIINVENYKKVKVRRSKKTISSKYELKKYRIYETKDDIELNNLIGKILFVRSKKFNANVFQVRTKIETNKDKQEIPTLMQIDHNIEHLRIGMLLYLGLDTNTKPIKETLTGNSKYNFEVPLRENIYTEKREYSGTYLTLNQEEYDINFYMDDEYLVCELVNFLEHKKK